MDIGKNLYTAHNHFGLRSFFMPGTNLASMMRNSRIKEKQDSWGQQNEIGYKNEVEITK